jgi:hypothetical protein
MKPSLSWIGLIFGLMWAAGAEGKATQLPLRAQGVYVDSLRKDQLAGKSSSDGYVDVYVYGPTNGNPADIEGTMLNTGPGPLIFSRLNVIVKDCRWSVKIEPALRDTEGSDYYQINLNQTWKEGHTESSHAQDGLDLFRVDNGPPAGSGPSASFQKDSLKYAGLEKNISVGGYASNTSTITMAVSKDGKEVDRENAAVINGEWEAGNGKPLTDGTYDVKVFDKKASLLAEGNIIAEVNWATIDKKSSKMSLSAKGGPAISGSASIQVVGCLVSSSYTGKMYYDTLRQLSLKTRFRKGTPQQVDCEPNLDPNAPRFRIRIPVARQDGFGGFLPGEYKALIFEGTASHELLTSGTIILTK